MIRSGILNLIIYVVEGSHYKIFSRERRGGLLARNRGISYAKERFIWEKFT